MIVLVVHEAPVKLAVVTTLPAGPRQVSTASHMVRGSGVLILLPVAL